MTAAPRTIWVVNVIVKWRGGVQNSIKSIKNMVESVILGINQARLHRLNANVLTFVISGTTTSSSLSPYLLKSFLR